MSKDRYLLSFYNVNDGADTAFAKEVSTLRDRVREGGGNFVVPPIRNAGPIESAALPDYTTNVPGNFILVSAFPSQKQLDAYVEKTKSSEISSSSSDVEIVAITTAKIFKPMPFMPKAPVLGDIEHKGSPAFLLLNGISMNSMLNPMTPIRMMRYMNANLGTLEKNGVVLLEAFQITETIQGEYGFDMLFLTEWPSQEVYDAIHNDPKFINLARATRNKAFAKFADDKGLIQFPDPSDSSEEEIQLERP